MRNKRLRLTIESNTAPRPEEEDPTRVHFGHHDKKTHELATQPASAVRARSHVSNKINVHVIPSEDACND
jgi:hypothetical protein